MLARIIVVNAEGGDCFAKLQESEFFLQVLDIGQLDSIDQVDQFKALLDELVNLLISLISNLHLLNLILKGCSELHQTLHSLKKALLGPCHQLKKTILVELVCGVHRCKSL